MFRVRGRSFLALVLGPEPPLADWLVDLDGQMRRSPAFFEGRPVLLDIAAVPPDDPLLPGLIAELHGRGIRVIGVEGAGLDVAVAGMWGRPLAGGRAVGLVEVVSESPAPSPPAAEATAEAPPPVPVHDDEPAHEDEPHALVLEEPVRSGQSVIFPNGDVTVLGSVASGAEVFAGGSIHIYGTLRGRAVAGFTGNPRARVFCRRFQAELVAINGVYQTADAIEPSLRGRPVQAWLEGDSIVMAVMD